MECDLICEKYETEIKKNLVKQENLKKEETLNYIFEDFFLFYYNKDFFAVNIQK